jgi:hypothetical protein
VDCLCEPFTYLPSKDSPCSRQKTWPPIMTIGWRILMLITIGGSGTSRARHSQITVPALNVEGWDEFSWGHAAQLSRHASARRRATCSSASVDMR